MGVENKFSKFSCYIDDWKLPSTKLKLRQVQKGLPVGSRALYRLTSVEEYKTQVYQFCKPELWELTM